MTISKHALDATYVDAPNEVLSAPNGVDYAYRSTGEGTDAPRWCAVPVDRCDLQAEPPG